MLMRSAYYIWNFWTDRDCWAADVSEDFKSLNLKVHRGSLVYSFKISLNSLLSIFIGWQFIKEQNQKYRFSKN